MRRLPCDRGWFGGMRGDRAMTKTTIHLVTGIQGVTLVVFFTDASCWQFRVNFTTPLKLLKRQDETGLRGAGEVRCDIGKGKLKALP